MFDIVGQDNLIKKLNNYTLDTFPHSIILSGEEGSGKHMISNYISENILKLPLIDISDKISYETIDNIYRNPNPTIYFINTSSLVEKEQNSLLKFIEEPFKSIFIIIACENLNILLNTVLNRCVVFELEEYRKEDLKKFIPSNLENKDLILNVVKTPGKLINTNIYNLTGLFDLCDKIIEKLGLASYANTLSISDKLNYKDNYDKYDLNIFFDTLLYKLYLKYKEENNSLLLDMYLLTVDYRKKLVDKRLNKEILIQNYLTNLWKLHKSKVSL